MRSMTHRVGTITLGVTMISIGVIFLVQLFFDVLDYGWIWKLWPVIFIMLGVEVLLANAGKKRQFVYDKAGIVLTFLLTGFAVGMAVVGEIMGVVEAGVRVNL